MVLSPRPVEQLEKAADIFDETHHQFVAPTHVAEVLMYLALGYLEQDASPTDPLDVMKRMILLDPARILRPGFYPDEVVRFYRSSRLTLEREIRENGPRTATAQELARLADADYVATGNVVAAGDGGYDVFVHFWSVDEQTYLPVESATIAGLVVYLGLRQA